MEVTALGKNYSISTKHAIAICKFIRGKTIAEAISLLEKVKGKKIAVPMKGEIPHRKGNIERGRYPVKASSYFVKLLKNLRGNASSKNLEADATVIKIARADKGDTPTRIGRMRRAGKRTHIMLIGEGKEEARVQKKEKPAKAEKRAEEKPKEEEKKETK